MAMTEADIQLMSDKVIENSAGALAIIGDICADVSTDDGVPYSGVAVHIIKAAAENFDADSNNYGDEGSSDTIATIKLGNHKKVTYAVTDKGLSEANYAPAINRYAPTAGKALGRAAYDAVVGAITGATGKESASVATDTSVLTKCAEIGEHLKNTKKLSPADCVLVLESGEYAKLLKELPASVIGTGDYVASGRIGEFLGFKRVISASFTGGDGNFAYVAPMGSIAFAARTIPFGAVGNTLVDSAVMVDPASGVGFGFRAVRDEFKGKTLWNYELLFGVEETYSTDIPDAPRVIGYTAA